MKRITIAGLLMGVFCFGTCKKDPALPACILQKIAAIKAQPKWNPAAQVDEYWHNDKRIFLFSSPCCDQYTQAYDEACNVVCAPSGGITGKGDGRCSNFATAAKFVRTIWKDER